MCLCNLTPISYGVFLNGLKSYGLINAPWIINKLLIRTFQGFRVVNVANPLQWFCVALCLFNLELSQVFLLVVAGLFKTSVQERLIVKYRETHLEL